MLADADAMESDANEAEEVAATSLLHAKDAKRTVRSSTQSAHDAELEAQVCVRVCERACAWHVCVYVQGERDRPGKRFSSWAVHPAATDALST